MKKTSNIVSVRARQVCFTPSKTSVLREQENVTAQPDQHEWPNPMPPTVERLQNNRVPSKPFPASTPHEGQQPIGGQTNHRRDRLAKKNGTYTPMLSAPLASVMTAMENTLNEPLCSAARVDLE